MAKRGGAKEKGSTFEREVCRQLSRWWTGGKRDDIFWRTAASGSMGTVRGRRGHQRTHGQHGDLQSVDPEGQAFTRLCVLELKRGYGDVSFADAIDREKGGEWRGWIQQARESQEAADTPYWMLIHQRDRRLATACFPFGLYQELRAGGAGLRGISLFAVLRASSPNLVVMRLGDFCMAVSPNMIRKVWRNHDQS